MFQQFVADAPQIAYQLSDCTPGATLDNATGAGSGGGRIHDAPNSSANAIAAEGIRSCRRSALALLCPAQAREAEINNSGTNVEHCFTPA